MRQPGQDPAEVSPAQFDVFPERLQYLRFREIVSDGKQMVPIPVDVEVIAAVTRFLTAAVDKKAHVRLVGALVLGKTHIPVDPVRTVCR